MVSENQKPVGEFSQLAAPLLDQLGVDFLTLDAQSAGLPELVAITEHVESLKTLAEEHVERRTFQFCFGLEEVLSGVLCERFDDPASVLAVTGEVFGVLKTHVESLGADCAEIDEKFDAICQRALKTIFDLLEVPIVEFPGKVDPDDLSFLYTDGDGQEDAAAFPASASPLLEELAKDIMAFGENLEDLSLLVGAIERLDGLKDQALEHREERTFQITHGVSDLLSKVLCDEYEDPKNVLRVAQDSLGVLKESLGTPDEDGQGVSRVQFLFDILDAPPAPLPSQKAAPQAPQIPEVEETPEQPAEIQAPSSDADADEEGSSTGLPQAFDDEEIYKEFAFECNEHLETIEENILELENSPEDTDLINEIFRPIHSIKGGAGFLSLKGMSKLAHVTETLLDRCRKLELPVTNRIVEVSLKSVDALKQMIANLVQAVESPDADAFTCPPVVFAPIKQEIQAILEGREKEEAVAQEPPAVPAAPVAPQESAPPPAAKSEPEPEPDLTDETYASKGLPKDLSDPDDVDLLKRFVLQCNEHTDLIEEKILSLEEHPDDAELINGIFRAIHSIKGDAGFLYLIGISSLAHETETLLDKLRNKQMDVTSRSVELCLQSVDALKQMIGNLNQIVDAPDPVEALAKEDLPLVVFGPIRQGITEFLKDPEKPPRLGEILVESGEITPEQLQSALELQEAPLGEVLEKTGMVPAQKVKQALTQQRKAGGAGATTAAKAIKVDTSKIDLLVNLVGELVIIEAQVAQMVSTLSGEAAAGLETQDNGQSQILEKNLSHLGKITKELQDRAMALRMMPIKQTFQKMVRLVRDSSKKMGKKVQLVMDGEDTELDKSVVEQISDPLVHMLRNCVDHGLENPEERKEAGKPEAGIVNLDAFYQGDQIKIRVKDDGKGLNRERILEKAVENGLLKPDDTPSDDEIYNLIFEPGFSTAKEVTDISGRGVGMDVVRKNIDKLRGTIDVQSVPGKGTTITISLPLTLAIIDGMIVRVGDEEFIIPTVAIKESLRPRKEEISTVTGRGELVNVRGDLTPLLRLYDIWKIKPLQTDPCEALVVIVENGGKSACIMVDELVGQQQIVIKNLGEQFSDVRGIMGATILGSGRVGLILDMDGLMKRALE